MRSLWTQAINQMLAQAINQMLAMYSERGKNNLRDSSQLVYNVIIQDKEMKEYVKREEIYVS